MLQCAIDAGGARPLTAFWLPIYPLFHAVRVPTGRRFSLAGAVCNFCTAKTDKKAHADLSWNDRRCVFRHCSMHSNGDESARLAGITTILAPSVVLIGAMSFYDR